MKRYKQTVCAALLKVQGQATIEYVLMLSTIVVLVSAFMTAFHNDIVRWLFSFVGQMLPTKTG